jgi:hypothetical protein
MALEVTTVAASSIATTSARLNGSFVVDTGFCCDSPCCNYTERFFYGTSSPPGTSVTAGSVCGNPSICSGGLSFNLTQSGLTKDTTYYFQARVSGSGCFTVCGTTDSGSILNFKTLADVMTITNVANAAPSATTCEVSCTFNPNTVTSTANLKVQFKLDSEPVTWTDGSTISGLSGTSGVTRTFTLSGLVAATAYDFRFVATRNAQNNNSLTSSEGSFTTAASSQTTQGDEVATATDAVSVTITGPSAQGAELLDIGIGEQVSIEIRSTVGEELSGVWFYHFPTRSYWFWTLPGFSAALTSTDGRGDGKTWIALGSTVYLVDDESYAFDDLDQTRPIDTSGEFEMPLSVSPKTIDFKGRYGMPMSVDVKIGADTAVDPTGTVRVEVTSDQYPGGPQTRRLIGQRLVELAPDKAGIDEWRRYSLGRCRPVNAAGIRLSFPRGQHPKRKNRVVLQAIRLESGLTELRRRRR